MKNKIQNARVIAWNAYVRIREHKGTQVGLFIVSFIVCNAIQYARAF